MIHDLESRVDINVNEINMLLFINYVRDIKKLIVTFEKSFRSIMYDFL